MSTVPKSFWTSIWFWANLKLLYFIINSGSLHKVDIENFRIISFKMFRPDLSSTTAEHIRSYGYRWQHWHVCSSPTLAQENKLCKLHSDHTCTKRKLQLGNNKHGKSCWNYFPIGIGVRYAIDIRPLFQLQIANGVEPNSKTARWINSCFSFSVRKLFSLLIVEIILIIIVVHSIMTELHDNY